MCVCVCVRERESECGGGPRPDVGCCSIKENQRQLRGARHIPSKRKKILHGA